MTTLGDFTPSKFGMVHAVADVVLILGITVWLNGKINTQNTEIEVLKKQNEILLQRILDIEKRLGTTPNQVSGPTESDDEEEINVTG